MRPIVTDPTDILVTPDEIETFLRRRTESEDYAPRVGAVWIEFAGRKGVSPALRRLAAEGKIVRCRVPAAGGRVTYVALAVHAHHLPGGGA